MSEKEKKSRFGRILHKNRDKDQTSSGPPPDSAYASSEAPSGEPAVVNHSQTSDISKLDNEKKLEAVRKDDNLSVNPAGEVVEKDTGDVVTTVTTTTTTTTTTKTRGGQKQTEEVKEVKRDPPVTTAATTNRDSAVVNVSELSSDRTPPDTGGVNGSPPVPPKSAMRKSMELQPPPSNVPGTKTTPPPSPSRLSGHNFSYPSRAPPDHTGQLQQQQQPPSTMQNLKAAAHGIHGAGETLRGTLNSSVDRRFPMGRDAEKHAALVQRHDDVAARGVDEIDRAQFQQRGQPQRFVDPAAYEPQEQNLTVPEEVESSERKKGNRLSGFLRRKPVPGDEVPGGGDEVLSQEQQRTPAKLRRRF